MAKKTAVTKRKSEQKEESVKKQKVVLQETNVDDDDDDESDHSNPQRINSLNHKDDDDDDGEEKYLYLTAIFSYFDSDGVSASKTVLCDKSTRVIGKYKQKDDDISFAASTYPDEAIFPIIIDPDHRINITFTIALHLPQDGEMIEQELISTLLNTENLEKLQSNINESSAPRKTSYALTPGVPMFREAEGCRVLYIKTVWHRLKNGNDALSSLEFAMDRKEWNNYVKHPINNLKMSLAKDKNVFII